MCIELCLVVNVIHVALKVHRCEYSRTISMGLTGTWLHLWALVQVRRLTRRVLKIHFTLAAISATGTILTNQIMQARKK